MYLNKIYDFVAEKILKKEDRPFLIWYILSSVFSFLIPYFLLIFIDVELSNAEQLKYKKLLNKYIKNKYYYNDVFVSIYINRFFINFKERYFNLLGFLVYKSYTSEKSIDLFYLLESNPELVNYKIKSFYFEDLKIGIDSTSLFFEFCLNNDKEPILAFYDYLHDYIIEDFFVILARLEQSKFLYDTRFKQEKFIAKGNLFKIINNLYDAMNELCIEKNLKVENKIIYRLQKYGDFLHLTKDKITTEDLFLLVDVKSTKPALLDDTYNLFKFVEKIGDEELKNINKRFKENLNILEYSIKTCKIGVKDWILKFVFLLDKINVEKRSKVPVRNTFYSLRDFAKLHGQYEILKVLDNMYLSQEIKDVKKQKSIKI